MFASYFARAFLDIHVAHVVMEDRGILLDEFLTPVTVPFWSQIMVGFCRNFCLLVINLAGS